MKRNIAILTVLWIAIAAVWIVGFRWESIVVTTDGTVREFNAEENEAEPAIYRIESDRESGDHSEPAAEERIAVLSEENETALDPEEELVYVVNTKTKKIHLPDCSSVAEIREGNRSETDDPESLLSQGYSWCKRCHG